MTTKKEIVSTKDPAIVKALNLINKQFGDDAMMTFDSVDIIKLPSVSTGSLNLDLALGIGGLPLGRIVEIFGPESSGKSTLCMHVCANAQKAGYKVAYLDLEHAFDPMYGKNLGIDMNNLLFSQPNSGEQAFQIMETLLKNKLADVIVFDSIASARTNSEINGEIGDNYIGRQAKLMSDGLKKITPLAHEANCLCMFTNQIRMKIGTLYGSPETTSGGEAMKFYASVRMRISRVIKPLEGKEKEAVGNETTVKVIKNKVAPPFRTATFDIIYGKGISRDKEIIDLAIKLGFIERAGSWFSYEGNKIGQGKNSVDTWLTENQAIKEDIAKKILEKVESGFDIDETVEEVLDYDPITGEIIE